MNAFYYSTSRHSMRLDTPTAVWIRVEPESQKLQQSLDFAGSILQHYGLSEFALPALPISFTNHRPAVRRLPILPVAPTGRRLTRSARPRLARGAGAAGNVEENA